MRCRHCGEIIEPGDCCPSSGEAMVFTPEQETNDMRCQQCENPIKTIGGLKYCGCTSQPPIEVTCSRCDELEKQLRNACPLSTDGTCKDLPKLEKENEALRSAVRECKSMAEDVAELEKENMKLREEIVVQEKQTDIYLDAWEELDKCKEELQTLRTKIKEVVERMEKQRVNECDIETPIPDDYYHECGYQDGINEAIKMLKDMEG